MPSTARTLNVLPDADTVAALRDEAAEDDQTVEVTYPGPDGTDRRLVVSPRGTCVVLQDTRENSFIPSVPAEEVAAALRE